MIVSGFAAISRQCALRVYAMYHVCHVKPSSTWVWAYETLKYMGVGYETLKHMGVGYETLKHVGVDL